MKKLLLTLTLALGSMSPLTTASLGDIVGTFDLEAPRPLSPLHSQELKLAGGVIIRKDATVSLGIVFHAPYDLTLDCTGKAQRHTQDILELTLNCLSENWKNREKKFAMYINLAETTNSEYFTAPVIFNQWPFSLDDAKTRPTKDWDVVSFKKQ